MKVKTIKQPWASLIVAGIKNIENRSQPTKYRGRILIHSSAKPAGLILDLLNENQLSQLTDEQYTNVLCSPFSAIIGSVEIVDCVVNHPSIWAEKTFFDEFDPTHNEKPTYNWVLANPIKFDEPILNVKGKLSFWQHEVDLCVYCGQPTSEIFSCKNCK